MSQARRELIASGNNVTAWKVWEKALVARQADSWSSLGLDMHEIPSLKKLMVLEGRVITVHKLYICIFLLQLKIFYRQNWNCMELLTSITKSLLVFIMGEKSTAGHLSSHIERNSSYVAYKLKISIAILYQCRMLNEDQIII